MNNFVNHMKKKIVDSVKDTSDEDLIRTIYTVLMEFQKDTSTEDTNEIFEITGTC